MQPVSIIIDVLGTTLKGQTRSGRVGSKKLDPDAEQVRQALNLTQTLLGSGSGSSQGRPDPEPILGASGLEPAVWCGSEADSSHIETECVAIKSGH